MSLAEFAILLFAHDLEQREYVAVIVMLSHEIPIESNTGSRRKQMARVLPRVGEVPPQQGNS